jgi:hypothetical protein
VLEASLTVVIKSDFLLIHHEIPRDSSFFVTLTPDIFGFIVIIYSLAAIISKTSSAKLDFKKASLSYLDLFLFASKPPLMGVVYGFCATLHSGKPFEF